MNIWEICTIFVCTQKYKKARIIVNLKQNSVNNRKQSEIKKRKILLLYFRLLRLLQSNTKSPRRKTKKNTKWVNKQYEKRKKNKLAHSSSIEAIKLNVCVMWCGVTFCKLARAEELSMHSLQIAWNKVMILFFFSLSTILLNNSCCYYFFARQNSYQLWQ